MKLDVTYYQPELKFPSSKLLYRHIPTGQIIYVIEADAAMIVGPNAVDFGKEWTMKNIKTDNYVLFDGTVTLSNRD